MDFSNDTIFAIALIMVASVVLGALLFLLVVRRLHKLDVPADAGFMETLRLTPFLVVLCVDLLDLGLDVLAAPAVWVILDRLGLKALRGVSTVEALIPFTGPVPTLTLCWIYARLTR